MSNHEMRMVAGRIRAVYIEDDGREYYIVNGDEVTIKEAGIEPAPDKTDERLLQLLRGPKVGADGKIVGGTYHGMTPAEVLAQRDAYNRIE